MFTAASQDTGKIRISAFGLRHEVCSRPATEAERMAFRGKGLGVGDEQQGIADGSATSRLPRGSVTLIVEGIGAGDQAIPYVMNTTRCVRREAKIAAKVREVTDRCFLTQCCAE